MKIGFKKIFRDIKIYKTETISMLVGVLIGTAAFGSVLSSYSILNREMDRNFMETNPVSIIVSVQNLDQRAKEIIKASYQNLEIDFRKNISARINNKDGTYGIIRLTAIENFNDQKIDTFTLENGSYPSDSSEIAVERDSFKILKNIKKETNEKLSITIPGESQKTLSLRGVVHAPGLAPASMENFSYGFLSINGLNNLGYKGWFDEIRIVSYDNRFDQDKLSILAKKIKNTLVENGYIVNKIDVPKPGKHPHANQLTSILFLLQCFAAISLLIASFIVINLVGFIMSKQSKQIAVMKTLGANSKNIILQYLFYIFLISLIGFILSIPLSINIAGIYSDFAAYILNFKIASYAIPYWVFILEGLIAIFIPLLSALIPIVINCKKSIRDTLNETVTSTNNFSFKKSPFAMPINNLIRKRIQSLLVIFALIAGGTLFMTSQNISASIKKTIDQSFQSFRWDYEIQLNKNYDENQIKNALKNISSLSGFEIWQYDSAFFQKPNGIDSANYQVKIISSNSQMVDFSISNPDEIVISKALAEDQKWLVPGLKTTLYIGKQTLNVTIKAIIDEIPDFSTIYLTQTAYQKILSQNPRQIILASATNKLISTQHRNTEIIENNFQSSGIQVKEIWETFILKKAFIDHLLVIMTLLSSVAFLSILVGGLSIACTTGINISERKREFGIMLAMGAKNYNLIFTILTEILIVAFFGWIGGIILSYPVSILMGNYFGQIFLHTNLQNVLSVTGSIEWLFISLFVSILSGLIPSHRLTKIPLREMLNYE